MKVFLNEDKIKAIIRETLDNMFKDAGIIPDNNITLSNIINSTFEYEQDFLNVKGKSGELALILHTKNYNDVYLDIYFDIDGYVTAYDKGDYWTPPSGGEFELEKLIARDAKIYVDEDEVNILQDGDFEYLEKILNKYSNEIIDEVDPEAFVYEPDDNWDSDAYYERKYKN